MKMRTMHRMNLMRNLGDELEDEVVLEVDVLQAEDERVEEKPYPRSKLAEHDGPRDPQRLGHEVLGEEVLLRSKLAEHGDSSDPRRLMHGIFGVELHRRSKFAEHVGSCDPQRM